MTVTILQTDIAWAQPELNIEKAERLISNAPKSDLYILPEMWNTGFVTNPDNMPEDCIKQCSCGNTIHSLEWMKNTAVQRNCAVCGSIATRTDNGQWFNRQYFVRPDFTVKHYDKHHLFVPGGENIHFTAGMQRTVAEYKGLRFLLATCYDLRFPLWLRYNDDFDAIIVVANWPASRQDTWHILLRARAIENQCYVLAANRTGTDKSCDYIGGSAVIDAYGRTVIQCRNTDEQAITSEIHLEELHKFRNKFRVLDDMD